MLKTTNLRVKNEKIIVWSVRRGSIIDLGITDFYIYLGG